MRANGRQKEIRRILIGRSTVYTTMNEIRNHLPDEYKNVTTRTIRSDIQALNEDYGGFHTQEGRGGGVKYIGKSKYGRVLSVEQSSAVRRAIEYAKAKLANQNQTLARLKRESAKKTVIHTKSRKLKKRTS
jgi:hypothetical protein